MHNRWKALGDYVEAVVQDVPVWLYGLALGLLIVGSAIAFIKRGRNKGLRVSAGLFLLFYVVVLFCSTVFFRRTMGATTRNWYDPLWHYRLIGQGKVLLFPEVIMNVVVFVPIGLALGLAFRKAKGWQAIMAGTGISVGIELLQWLFRKGFADVDDVIHNTLGCVVGYLLYRVLKRVVLYGKGAGEKETNALRSTESNALHST